MTSASCNAARHGKNDDYDDEGSDFSPSLHKKEMLDARHDDGLEDDRSYSDDRSNGPPDLLLLVMTMMTKMIGSAGNYQTIC
jgi:hypothetical protein